MRSSISCAILTIALYMISSIPAIGGTPRFNGLGDLPGGAVGSGAYGVSADGTVVVGRSWSSTGSVSEAFRWTQATGMIGLGYLPTGNYNSMAYGISDSGNIIAGESRLRYGGIWTDEAIRWSNGVMQGIGALPGAHYSTAFGISPDGSTIVGGSETGHGYYAFRWKDGQMTSLGDLSAGIGHSFARAASLDGSVIVGRGTSSAGDQAFRWTAQGGMVGLPFNEARDVSLDGSVIVGTRGISQGFEACRWENGVLEGLGDLPGGSVWSIANAISGDGSVIVGYGDSGVRSEAFIWDREHGIRSLKNVLETEFGLNLTGWTLQEARAISSDGLTIVGDGINPYGIGEAWVAHVPEPATLSLLSLGAYAIFRRKKQ